MDLNEARPMPRAGGAPALRDRLAAVAASLAVELVDRAELVERLLTGLLAGGHILLEGAPGLAKTRAVKLLAASLDAPFARIQCTPDLMPSDLTGTTVWLQDRGRFEFVRGPVFASIVLVDEINRAPPKVQSALLEAMAERQVTAAGSGTHLLPDPFMVVATQNPIEHEGTFPLPEAELDRFLLHTVLDMPGAAAERLILDLVEREAREESPPPMPRLALAELRAAQRAAMGVHLAPALRDYIVRLVSATRDRETGGDVAGCIQHPVSPRGSLALAAGAKARAWLRGRDYATPDDVAALAGDALAHRLVLTWRAVAEGQTTRGVVARILDRVPAA